MSDLVELLRSDPSVAQAIDLAADRTAALDLTVTAGARPAFAATLAESTKRPLLIVTSTYREAEQLSAALGSLCGPDQICYYPAWETLPHERLSPSPDIVGARLAVLRRLAGHDPAGIPTAVVLPVRAALQPQVKGLSELEPIHLAKGDTYDLEQLSADLVAIAYSRVDLVERRGDFAVRGGIVDVFPPTERHPVRLDFFGDEIDTIQHFALADQRSLDEELDQVVIAPCRELLLTPQVRSRAAALVGTHPELAELLERIAQGQTAEGMEALSPALVDDLELIFDVAPTNSLVLVCDPELVRSRAADLVRTSREFLDAGWAAAATGGAAPIDLGSSAYRELADVRGRCLELGLGWWSLSPFATAPDDVLSDVDAATLASTGSAPDEVSFTGVPTQRLHLDAVQPWHGKAEAAFTAIRAAVQDRQRVVLSVDGTGAMSRASELLRDEDIPNRTATTIRADLDPGLVTIAPGEFLTGFAARDINLLFFTSSDLFGHQAPSHTTRRLPSRRRNQVVPIELKPGDALVHEQHGVGRYIEMTHRTVAGATREYIVVEYAPSKRGQPGDRLYVPMDQLDLITRYVGGEVPTLDRLDGSDWKQRKSRARKAVRHIAAELIKLYAARQATRGHQFGPDTPWQRELEDSFAYIETPDQLSAINDVKHDMEQEVPMDRLICGDVGYGKTEIAVRAAFKAVQDGKQVALLVPTTLLVQQHMQTFQARYAGFPVLVAPVSRFQSDSEVAATLDGLAAGRVDVVIGTHRLLSEKVQFKDLGLVIIDEEQRFGVEHKETLKKFRVNVDVLSMSATPIPRTLEMAITGIREMSTISTPPEDRHPVLTFVGAYDTGQVVAAIRRELAREGQVFYVHNRVNQIDKIANQLRELVPEARIVTAHGKMSEKRLEQVMVDFWERRADVLVCTTIVEAGLDISSANTLLIDDSDRMGLSQLHQLRGRVGRGRARGYAYFMYPPEKVLSETAHDRLAALASNADFGAGMAIAMKDLEIRGAGNLLGEEQSGHIADVGFDLYLRLVGEAVADFRGEDTDDDIPMRIELPIDAHLPTDYVNSERLRLEMYKRIAEVRGPDDIASVREELVDRYGPIPPSAAALFDVARFRLLCRSVGLREVVSQGSFIRFAPIGGERGVELPESRQMRLSRLYPGSLVKQGAHLMLVPSPVATTKLGVPLTDAELLGWATDLVHAIFETNTTKAAS